MFYRCLRSRASSILTRFRGRRCSKKVTKPRALCRLHPLCQKAMMLCGITPRSRNTFRHFRVTIPLQACIHKDVAAPLFDVNAHMGSARERWSTCWTKFPMPALSSGMIGSSLSRIKARSAELSLAKARTKLSSVKFG